MRKYHEILANATASKRVGNHSVKVGDEVHEYDWTDDIHEMPLVDGVKGTRIFYYHDNAICVVDDKKKTFRTHHAGWFTSSIHTAIMGYRKYFIEMGYTNETPRICLQPTLVLMADSCWLTRAIRMTNGEFWITYKGEKWVVIEDAEGFIKCDYLKF